jgi:hypothetical protein
LSTRLAEPAGEHLEAVLGNEAVYDVGEGFEVAV